MTDAVRRGRPGYDQETVLRRAIDLFNRQGYDATSMGDLARELGLTKSAIYHHVPSKEHLLASGLDEALDALSSTVTALGGDDLRVRPSCGCGPRSAPRSRSWSTTCPRSRSCSAPAATARSSRPRSTGAGRSTTPSLSWSATPYAKEACAPTSSRS